MVIVRVDPPHAAATIALLGDLDVSLYGVQSPALHAALVRDGIAGRIDCRIAVDGDRVHGVVVAAPKTYWWNLLLRRWDVAGRVVAARVAALIESSATRAHAQAVAAASPSFDSGVPGRTWSVPGEAWRIIFVGTAASARGQGIAARLYESVMADHALVAHVATDNVVSLRLHRSLGWKLFPDGNVVLAVHRPG